MANIIRTAGRPAAFSNKANLVAALTNLDKVSRYLVLELVEKGYVKIEVVKSGGKGRPAHKYVLTGKAKGYLALARNWGRKTENLVHKVEVETVEADEAIAA